MASFFPPLPESSHLNLDSWQEIRRLAGGHQFLVQITSLPAKQNTQCAVTPKQVLSSSETWLLAREADTENKREDGAEGSLPSSQGSQYQPVEECPRPYKSSWAGLHLLPSALNWKQQEMKILALQMDQKEKERLHKHTKFLYIYLLQSFWGQLSKFDLCG